jgi:hypothetical protein
MAELTLSIDQGNKCFVNRLIKAYVGLVLTPHDEHGWRTMSLAHFGVFEVRLMEIEDCRPRDGLDLWIELYRHDTRSSIDSCRCWDLDEAEHLAEQFSAQAKKLHESRGDES